MNNRSKQLITLALNILIKDKKLFNTKHNIIFNTDSGIIKGDIVEKNEIENIESLELLPLKTLDFSINQGKNVFEISKDDYLFLKNVSIFSGDKIFKIPFYVIFLETIKGVSVGSIDNID